MFKIKVPDIILIDYVRTEFQNPYISAHYSAHYIGSIYIGAVYGDYFIPKSCYFVKMWPDGGKPDTIFYFICG